VSGYPLALPCDSPGFRHEALLYQGEDDFLARTASFIREGLAAGEPTLVVVSAAKIDRLQACLGDQASGVQFLDMAEVGANPARIIPAWRRFVDEHQEGARRFRGIGEPISASRSAAELVECQRHESLLNAAFDGGPEWRLLCPYDTEALPPEVIEEARRSHPLVALGTAREHSAVYRPAPGAGDRPLPDPAGEWMEVAFRQGPLAALRNFVSTQAVELGTSAARAADLVQAMNEVAGNSLRHGGGEGVLRMWQEAGSVICEIRDGGHITDPLVDRRQPASDTHAPRGLWLANQLCDLVQVRSLPTTGTVVRLHVRLA
jgi:anti-sigma regulatory factor (Ser/Thr protein kinase)